MRELKPAIEYKRLPAQVGHPIRRPVDNPRLPKTLPFDRLLIFMLSRLITNKFKETLSPTKTEIMIPRKKLSGISRKEKLLLMYIVNIGT